MCLGQGLMDHAKKITVAIRFVVLAQSLHEFVASATSLE